MSSLKRFFAGASAVALAAGTTLAGAGVVSAQDEGDESTGSLSSSSLNLGDTAADLELAATALDGPVTVSPNEEGGPTVTYLNETGNAQECLGFTLPYSTIDEEGIDPSSIDTSDLTAAGELLNQIDAAGGVSLLTVTTDGQGNEPVQVPFAEDSYEPGANGENDNGGILQMVGEWVLGVPNAYAVAPDDSVEWVATAPETPSAAAILCTTEVEQGEEDPGLQTYFGIDPQVVADQINGRIPGGSLEIVSPDMISGGSVETGAMALGSLAGGGAEEDPPVEPVE